MGFRKFIDTKKRGASLPMISIWTRGQISFNTVAAESLHLKDYSHIELYFDHQKRLIGLNPTNIITESIPINFRDGGLVNFSAIPFLRSIGIFGNKTAKYIITDDRKVSGLYVVGIGHKVGP